MDFYLDYEFQTNHDITHPDVPAAEHFFNKTVYDTFVRKLGQAFPEGSFSIRTFDVSDACEANAKAA